MASKQSTRDPTTNEGEDGQTIEFSLSLSLGVFWQIYVSYDGSNIEVNNGVAGACAIDGDRWRRFELEEEITSPPPPPSPLPPLLLSSPASPLSVV